MKKSASSVAPPFSKETDKGGSGDNYNKELSKNIVLAKIIMPLLAAVIALALLAITYSWFKELTLSLTQSVTISSKYITTLYFEDFERDQQDTGNYRGQTGLNAVGGDAPYEARFFITVAADENSPLPLRLVLNISSATVKKTSAEAVALTEQQIADNFRIKLYNPSTLQETDTADSALTDYILIIRYWGETENVPFEFSDIEYNGAKFTFAIDMFGEVVQ